MIFTPLDMLAMVMSESSSVHTFVSNRRPAGLHRDERSLGVCVCVCHRGHYEGLSRCQLVRSCVLPSENFFTYIKPRLHA